MGKIVKIKVCLGEVIIGRILLGLTVVSVRDALK